MSVPESLAQAERHLDRMQAFFSRIDAKSSALLGLATALVGVLAAVVSLSDLGVWWIGLPVAAFVACIVTAYACLFDCARPHTKGGSGSLFYFVSIASRPEHDFIDAFEASSPDMLRRDALAQVWRNAEILTAKFSALRRATYAVVLSALCWSVSLVGIICLHGRIPFGHP